MTGCSTPNLMDNTVMSPLHRLRNATPVMWAMLGIPLATILASAVTIFLAVDDAEPLLPPQYVSEGKALDADLALAEAAKRANVRVELAIESSGRIELRLDSNDPSPPESLRLRLTHATLPALDRDLILQAVSPGRYVARTTAVNLGTWLVQVDADSRWRVRGRIQAPTARVSIGN